ncbi:MAG: sugar porter family MFS transporter [Chthoniobacterales bacterium]|nr:sugar porter family MFS transporter [Chthoniobacterales bacterium]
MSTSPQDSSSLPAAHGRVTASVIQGTIIAALGGLLFGFDTAVISGTTEALNSVFQLTAQTLGFTVAVALIGTVIGSIIVGKPVDAFGRKKMLLLIALLYFVSAIGCAVAESWIVLVVARFVGGLGVGAASVVAPMYIAEIAPGSARGRLVAINQLNVVAGILLAFLSNYVLSLYVGADWAWRAMLGIEAIPAAVFFFLIFTIPESPRWLVKKGLVENARDVLEKLGVVDTAAKIAEIKQSLDGNGGKQDALFQRRYSKSVLLVIAIAMFNQLAGINALMYYAPKIFMMAGAAVDSALFQAVLVGGTNFVFTALALLVIDRFGRRILMLIGSLGLIVTLSVVAWQFSLGGAANGSIVLIALLVYIAFFAFSQGACIWVFISEVFPNTVRAKGQALGSFTHWFMAAAVSWSFPVVAAASGAWAFGFFAGMMVLQLLWVIFLMPETKGGSLEDIERRLGHG